MKANKHEINGYIYVTSEEIIKVDDFVVTNYQYNNKTANKIYGMTPNGMYSDIGYEIMTNRCKKIILCNNPNLPIQQLTEQEVEYLKGVDSFEVYRDFSDEGIKGITYYGKYKILIPQETEKTKDEIDRFFVDMVCNPKESIEEENPINFLMTNLYKKGYLKEVDGNEPINLMNVAKEKLKQTLYTEEQVELIANEMVNWTIDNIGNPNPESGKKFDEVLNKHKKQ